MRGCIGGRVTPRGNSKGQDARKRSKRFYRFTDTSYTSYSRLCEADGDFQFASPKYAAEIRQPEETSLSSRENRRRRLRGDKLATLCVHDAAWRRVSRVSISLARKRVLKSASRIRGETLFLVRDVRFAPLQGRSLASFFARSIGEFSGQRLELPDGRQLASRSRRKSVMILPMEKKKKNDGRIVRGTCG